MRRSRGPTPPGLWLDRALCALLVLLSLAALLCGALTGDPALVGMAVFGLVGAGWVGCVVFDDATRRRERAVREALGRGWR